MNSKRFGDWCEKHEDGFVLFSLIFLAYMGLAIGLTTSWLIFIIIFGGSLLVWFLAVIANLDNDGSPKKGAYRVFIGLTVASAIIGCAVIPQSYANYTAPKVEVVCATSTTNASTIVVIDATTTATVTRATTEAFNSTYYEIASEVHTCP